MTFLPVVAREMRVLARRKSTHWARAGTAVAALLVMGWLLAVSAANVPFIQLGRSIFVTLSYIGFAYALVAGIHATADCISGEKREGTLGLLFLTDLRSYDIVLGKLSATSLSAAYALLAIVPMISLGLLVGGVTLMEVAHVSAVLGNTLFFSLGLGVFISTLSKNERKSIFASSVILFLMTAAPFVLVFSIGWMRTEDLIWISPLYPMLTLHLKGAVPIGFTGANWPSAMLLHHCLGWLCLIGSCLVLPRLIHELPAQRFAGIRKLFEDYAYGKRGPRNSYRARLLDRNAFLWLVSRERVKPAYAWFLVLFFVGLYLWLHTSYPNLLFDLPINCVILMTVHFTLKLWLASEVCNRLIQDRSSGALELLLSTPLSVRAIARGQGLALRRIFFYPLAIIVAGECILSVAALRSDIQRPPPVDRAFTYLAAASSLMIDVWALKWVGLWRSLWGKSNGRVLATTLIRVLGIPWVIFASVYGVAIAFAAFVGSEFTYRQLLVSWWVISILCSLGFALPARSRFLRYFRACAANRFEAGTPVLEASEAEHYSSPLSGFPFVVRKRAVAKGFAVLLLILLSGTLGRKMYWKHRVSSEVNRIRAAKLPASASEVMSFFPRPASDVNPAALLFEAGQPSKIGNGFLYWNGGNFDWRQDSAFEETIQHNERQLSALWRLTNYSSFYYPSTNVVSDLFSQYTMLGCMDYLVASAKGDHQRVFRDICGLVSHIRLLRHSPSQQAQHFANDALINLTFVLQRRHSLPDDLLARIGSELEASECDEVLGPSLAVMRAWVLNHNVSFSINYDPNRVNGLTEIMNSVLKGIGSHHKQLFLALRIIEFGVGSSTLPYPERLDRMQEWQAIPPWMPPGAGHALERQFQRSVANAYWRHAEITARLNVLRAAIAAQRHFIANGVLPASLDDLVPKYLREVPLDPFSGEPLHRVTLRSGGYFIYSVGPNRTDEKGTSHPISSGMGDIVYRF